MRTASVFFRVASIPESISLLILCFGSLAVLGTNALITNKNLAFLIAQWASVIANANLNTLRRTAARFSKVLVLEVERI